MNATELYVKLAYEAGFQQALLDSGIDKEALLRAARQGLFRLAGGSGSALNAPLFGTSTKALASTAAKPSRTFQAWQRKQRATVQPPAQRRRPAYAYS
jgi:hypothetical protein